MKYTLKTESQKGDTVSVKSNTGTLKKVWFIFKDIKLENLLTYGSVENINLVELIDNLLTHNKLGDFIQTIAPGIKTEIDDLDFQDIVGIATAFFTSMAQPFQGLLATQINMKIQKTMNETTPPTTQIHTTES